MRKFFRYFIIFLFVAFLGAGAILQTQNIRNRAKAYIITRIEEETGYRAEISDIHLFPSLQLTAKEIKLYEKDQLLFTCDHLHFGLYPYALWRGEFHLSRFHLEGVTVHSIPKREGEDLPIALIPLKIDEIMIDDLVINTEEYTNTDTPFTMRGSLSFDPEKSQAYVDFKLRSFDDPDKWYIGDFVYEKGEGSFRIDSEDEFQVDAVYLITPKGVCRIPRFHSSFGPIILDGNVAFTFDGKITESALFISTDDLSKVSSISGHFYGEGQMVGDIWAPEINLTLASDGIEIKGVRIEDVVAKVISVKTRKGLSGQIDLSFVREEHPFHFTGELSWEIEEGLPVFLAYIETDLMEIVQLLAFDLTNIGGRIGIKTEISQDGLRIRGEIINGLIESYEYGTLLTGIHAIVDGDLEKIELKQFNAGDGSGGKYSASGKVNLDIEQQFPFSFAIHLNKAAIVQLDTLKATADGNLKLTGNTDEGSLKGQITSHSVKMTLPKKSSPLPDSVEITYINQPESETLPTRIFPEKDLWPLKLDINVKVPGKAKVKGGELSSTWNGEVNIKGTSTKPTYHGQFKLEEGKYKVRGRSLELTEGTVTLSGDIKKKTTLYIIASMDIDRYTIEAVVKGSIRNPTIVLRSSPPISQRQILSLILFNKDISEISELQGDQLNRSLLSLSSQVDEGPDILTRLGNSLGVDRIDIGRARRGGEDQFSVEVGKYLGEKTYISISRHMSEDSSRPTQTNQVGIETDLGKNFKIRAEVDEDTHGQVNILWRKDY